MTTHRQLHFGPRLVATPTGRLQTAVVVKPSAAIERAKPLIGEPGAVYARALEQHETLRKTLEYFGVDVVVADACGADPYEVAAGDAAIVFGDGAVLPRLTALSRRGEVDRIETRFSQLDVPLAGHIAAPGLLDGNDVVLAGRTAFVGAGSRGNDVGRAGFAELARSHGYGVVEVRLPAGIAALRAVASAVADDTIVLGAGTVDPAAFDGFRTVVVELGEAGAAGALCVGERHVVADIRYRTALATMRRAGIAVEALDLYEFTKIGITPSMLVIALRRD